MNDLGQISLLGAFAFTLHALFASVGGGIFGKRRLVQSAARSMLCTLFFVTLAVVCLETLLLRSDFSNAYVWSITNHALPFFYKLSALWAGQDGSLLLWTWLLTIFTGLVLLQNRSRNRALMPYVIAVMAGTTLFFLTLNLFSANAFDAYHVIGAGGKVGIAFTPEDGNGLNPQLQNPYMVIHPPILYLGYVMFVVPFAFAIAALITGRLGMEWTKASRRWTLFSWMFLGFGIILGGHWAYEELGWGGYWAWDPVENASLMPWLTATAFLHSVMIQERKGMLRVWNMALVIVTYLLCIFGTFLTRSGVVSSVHSFAKSNLGPLFTIFLLTSAAFAFGLLLWRIPKLKSVAKMESMVSRESSFLFNNLLFLVACFAVFWGTMFPVISEAVTGDKIQVGPPWFNKVMVPLGLLIFVLMGVAPLFAWRRTSRESLVRNFTAPVVGSALLGAIFFALGMRQYYAIIAFVLCFFVAWTILAEFARGTRARMTNTREPAPVALKNLVYLNHRRYGGYIVHFAIVLLFMGFTGMAFRVDEKATLDLGETMKVKNYQLKLVDVREGAYPATAKPNYNYEYLQLALTRNGKAAGELRPERRQYLVGQKPVSTEVEIRSTLLEDLYVVFSGVENDKFIVQVYVNPLVSWVWVGAILLVLGAGVSIVPNPEAAQARKRRMASVGGLSPLAEGSLAD